jgi:hypothetical protein
MEELIYHINYDFDKDRLLAEYSNNKLETFSNINPKWKRALAIGSYTEGLVEHFKQYAYGKVIAGYWDQPANTKIVEHIDKTAKCRINVKLSEDDGVLHMGGYELKYESALLNVNEYPHWVSEVNYNRIIFSIIFLEDNYKTVRDNLKGV